MVVEYVGRGSDSKIRLRENVFVNKGGKLEALNNTEITGNDNKNVEFLLCEGVVLMNKRRQIFIYNPLSILFGCDDSHVVYIWPGLMIGRSFQFSFHFQGHSFVPFFLAFLASFSSMVQLATGSDN